MDIKQFINDLLSYFSKPRDVIEKNAIDKWQPATFIFLALIFAVSVLTGEAVASLSQASLIPMAATIIDLTIQLIVVSALLVGVTKIFQSRVSFKTMLNGFSWSWLYPAVMAKVVLYVLTLLFGFLMTQNALASSSLFSLVSLIVMLAPLAFLVIGVSVVSKLSYAQSFACCILILVMNVAIHKGLVVAFNYESPINMLISI